MILPYLDDFHFNFNDVHSLSISGHKFIGSPIPCDVYLTTKTIIDEQASYVEYVGINDATISGSRNALTTLFLWYSIHKHNANAFKRRVKRCMDLADYTINKLKQINITAWRNQNSPIVIFAKPSPKIVEKWQLAVSGNLAHIVTLDHINEATIDQFINDLNNDTSSIKTKKSNLVSTS
ncbi:hypothetical protein L3V82_05805 [Thiotrichales bacterium 19S3-7]|nr:hypothetical protein [Thiotrichales bacterium 19S3-7]MCF6801609.1 hypothetical protein [Thiotrichales bacterium 19S3-11]